jgi:SWI/SNF-related matrix-associated actin-dependent regulator 1 of chromatin subfamily A
MILSFLSGTFILKEAPYADREIIRKQKFTWNGVEKYWHGADAKRAIFFYEAANESAKVELDAYLTANSLTLQQAQELSVAVEASELIYLEHTGTYTLINLPFNDNKTAKDGELQFNWDLKRWETKDHNIAARFIHFAGPELQQKLQQILDKQKQSFAESSAASNDAIEIPVPESLSYLPYQRAGINYAIQRPHTLIGDDMGLGKTIQAIGVSNYYPEIRSILIICPASLKLNWKREFQKWDVKGLSVGLAIGKSFPSTDVAIINYDILSDNSADIHNKVYDLLILDEAHYLKNPKTIRCQQVFGEKGVGGIQAKRKLFLTGTPILNRPAEGWVLFYNLAPEVFGNYPAFTARYANGHRTGYGWNASGSSNLEELQAKLRSTVMVRRMKVDVLKELPPKRRQIIEFSGEGVQKLVKREELAFEKHQSQLLELLIDIQISKADSEAAYKATLADMEDKSSVSFEEFSIVRKDVAKKKLPFVISHIESALECGKVVVFCHHQSVVDAIQEAFPGSVSITGKTSMEKRQQAVDSFQTDPDVKLFVGNIQAAGVGLTLTASSHVIFCELSWVPGEVSQAEDRCHRLGQVQSVLVQHLLLEGSIDVTMAKRLIAKQEIIEKALDNSELINPDLAQSVIPKPPARENLSFAEIRNRIDFTHSAVNKVRAEDLTAHLEISKLTPALIEAVQRGLRYLARVCDGAVELDGAGFNRFDSLVGSRLAKLPSLTDKQILLGQKILYKYHGQLSADINIEIRKKEEELKGEEL